MLNLIMRRLAAFLLIVLISSIFFSFYENKKEIQFPSDKWIEEVNQLYRNHADTWNAEVATALPVKGGYKFILLRQVSTSQDGGVESYIAYDESDELSNPHGLHLDFWLQKLSTARKTLIEMNYLVVRQLGPHYYWIIKRADARSYALIKDEDHIKVIQWGCSVFNIPPFESCPDQWEDPQYASRMVTKHSNNPDPFSQPGFDIQR